MAQFGTARALPGETDTGRLSVGETRDGSPMELPVAVINGAAPGDTLYIQAASDGDELNGVGVVRRLLPSLDPNDLAGKIFVCGIVNQHAFRVAEHRNPVDDTKMNRTYPGDATGTSSERVAAATFEAASDADFILDLHQGSTSRMLEECRVRCGTRHSLHDACLELARVFGCGYIYDHKGPAGQLARVGPGEGIPAIDPELGGCVGWDKESIQKGLDGVFNVLTYYGFLPGNVDIRPQTRASNFEYYSAPAGGLVDFSVELGDRLSRGDQLFEVTDIFGNSKETVTANRSGVFWRSRRLPQVASGEYVCSVGVDIDTV